MSESSFKAILLSSLVYPYFELDTEQVTMRKLNPYYVTFAPFGTISGASARAKRA